MQYTEIQQENSNNITDKNPGFRPQGSNRVKRGGSWNNNANNCRVANRNNNNPDNANNNIGFRAVLPQLTRRDGCLPADPDGILLPQLRDEKVEAPPGLVAGQEEPAKTPAGRPRRFTGPIAPDPVQGATTLAVLKAGVQAVMMMQQLPWQTRAGKSRGEL